MVYARGKDFHRVIEDLNADLCNISRYLKCNSLFINVNKCKAMVLRNRSDFDCNCCDVSISEVN